MNDQEKEACSNKIEVVKTFQNEVNKLEVATAI